MTCNDRIEMLQNKVVKMQLDVDVSPPAISLLVDMNPKC